MMLFQSSWWLLILWVSQQLISSLAFFGGGLPSLAPCSTADQIFEGSTDITWQNSSRRQLLQTTVSLTVAGSTVISAPFPAHSAQSSIQFSNTNSNEANDDSSSSLTVPLQYSARLDAFLVHFTIGGDRFGAIVDTGSPFLTIPGTLCKDKTRTSSSSTTNQTSPQVSRWGCYQPRHSEPVPGLSDTMERFDNAVGRVQWRQAPFAFWNATGSIVVDHPKFVFGVLDEALMGGPGGVFFGLIRDTNPGIRPSFLGQTPVKSLALDLHQEQGGDDHATSNFLTSNSPSPALTLSTSRHIIPASIPQRLVMTKILNQQYRDPTIHYTLQASALKINGTSLIVEDEEEYQEDNNDSFFSRLLPRRRKPPRPIYVIVDTGVSGMVVSSDLCKTNNCCCHDMRFVSDILFFCFFCRQCPLCPSASQS